MEYMTELTLIFSATQQGAKQVTGLKPEQPYKKAFSST